MKSVCILATTVVATLALFASHFAIAAGETTPPVSRDLTARYFVNALDIKNQILADYRKLIQVYYQYKNKNLKALSKTPTYQEFDLFFQEFSSAQYNEFATELDADPRLNGNVYRDFMRSYGGSGADNDVMQRLYQHFDKKFAHLSETELDELHMRINRPMAALALTESKEIFANVSLAAGFPGNRQHSIEAQLKNYRLEIADLSMTYRIEISKARQVNERAARADAVRADVSPNAPCAPDFVKLQRGIKKKL